ncbi:RHS repeat-associated core domain-containing protein [Pseudomonas sp. O230]|uniref:RHS repeat-associated core domain-containing protein n=1 Tax=Pseudomonas sp. O230 TaxID=3159450 RepID=UPI00387B3E92
MLEKKPGCADTCTPSFQVSDARGLPVRTVQFHRREAGDPFDTRVTEQRFDAAGRLLASRDPYLFNLAHTDASAPFNLRQVTSLSGVALMTDSVDAGWRAVLPGQAGQSVEHWDGRRSHSLTEYDELLRPVAVREYGHKVAEHALERFTYADAGTGSAAHNLCGQLNRHDDSAGTLHVHDLSLVGNELKHTRQFLISTDPPNWPVDIDGRNALLEPGDGATTAYTFAPSSELLSQTDAFGNVQAFAYTVDGLLKNTKLTLAGAGQTEKLLVSNLHYTATGQIESETAGNGVITRHHYDEADGRLTQLSAHKADGTPLQDLNYLYDPVGNVLSIEDAAQPIRYFNNQRIEPIKTYQYDTLNQLIRTTGCEAQSGRGGPTPPDFQSLPLDPNQIANYTQTYHYDAGANLLDLLHVGPQAHSRTLTRARYSNRCLPERDNRPPTEEELADGFDANGNLRGLQVGQLLVWDLRNQLREVRPVVREDEEDDCECYIYDGGGQRVRKLHSSQTNARKVIREARYLPGVEIRSHSGTGEILHVITVSAGNNSVQVLHWASKPPDEAAQNQVRYSLGDLLKSSTLELDQNADLISQEWYYPFGGTAYWAGRNATEAKYKTVRYSGKERDATGLYYYGFRYYVPWLQRWINPDPAGYVDGLNLYRMTKNNPVRFEDSDGCLSKEERATRRRIEKSLPIIARGMTAITKNNPDLGNKIKAAMDIAKADLSNAIIAVETIIKGEDDGTYEGIISDYMGDVLTPEDMLSALTSLDNTRKQYGYNSQRITFVKSDDPTNLALVYSDQNIKNIYITDEITQHTSEQIATIITHEYTHITDELGTRDFYYLGIRGHPFDAQLQATKWLDNSYQLNEVDARDQSDFIEVSGESDMASALSKYETDKQFRAKVATGTADVWAHMIKSLSNRLITQDQHVYV